MCEFEHVCVLQGINVEVRADSWLHIFNFTLFDTGLCSLVLMPRLELADKPPSYLRRAGISDIWHLVSGELNSGPPAYVVYTLFTEALPQQIQRAVFTT